MRNEAPAFLQRSVGERLILVALTFSTIGHATGSQAIAASLQGAKARHSIARRARRTVLWQGHKLRHQKDAAAEAAACARRQQQRADSLLSTRQAIAEAEKLGMPSMIGAAATLEPAFAFHANEQQCNSTNSRKRIVLLQTEQLSECRHRCVNETACSHISFSKENRTCAVWSRCDTLIDSRNTQTFARFALLAGSEKPSHMKAGYRPLSHRRCGLEAVHISDAVRSKAHASKVDCEAQCTGVSDCLFAEYNHESRQCGLFSECSSFEDFNQSVVMAKTSIHQVPDTYQAFDFSSVGTSNLGGLGPDDGIPSIYYESVVTAPGGREVDLIVRNISDYTPFLPHFNGAHDQFGAINVKSGSSVDLLFQFVDQDTKEAYALNNLFFTFLNVDAGADDAGLLSIRVANVDGLLVMNSTELGTKTFPSGGVLVEGLSKTGFQEMPDHAFSLTAGELQHAVTVNLKRASQMLVTVTVAQGGEGKDVIFTGFVREANDQATAQPMLFLEREQRADEGDFAAVASERLIDYKAIQVFQCASETHQRYVGCPECSMTQTCLCDGLARFGYGELFTPWRRVDGQVSCSTAAFGDPFPGQAKICMCRPDPDVQVAVDPAGAPSRWPLLLVAGTFFLVHAAHRVSIVVGHFLPKSRLGPWYPVFMAVLEEATPATAFAPMLCVAFVAATKRAATLAAGQAQAHHLPGVHNHISMATCATAFCVQVLSCAGLVSLNALSIAALPLTVVLHVSVLVMYVALGLLVMGTLWMSQPQDVFAHHGQIPVATGTVCAIMLVMMYFGTYFLLHLREFVAPFAAIAASAAAAAPSSPIAARGEPLWPAMTEAAAAAGVPRWLHSPVWPSSRRMKAAAAEATNAVVSSAAPWRTAASAASLAPALGVVFLATQIAADAGDLRLPSSVATSMWVATISVGVMLLTVPIVPILSWISDGRPTAEGVLKEIIRRRMARAICWLSMAAIYLAVGTMFSCEIALPHMLLMTQGLSIPAGLFFFVYFLFFMAMTTRAVGFVHFTLLTKWLEHAQDAVEACPMYAATFLIYSWGWLLQFGTSNGYGQGSHVGFAALSLLAVGLQAAAIVVCDGTQDSEAAASIWFSDGSLDREAAMHVAATFKVGMPGDGHRHALAGGPGSSGPRSGAAHHWGAASAAVSKEARRRLETWDEDFRSPPLSRSAAKAALPASLSRLQGPWGRGAEDAAVAATLAASFAPPTPSYTPPVADLPRVAYKEIAHPVLVEKMCQGF